MLRGPAGGREEQSVFLVFFFFLVCGCKQQKYYLPACRMFLAFKQTNASLCRQSVLLYVCKCCLLWVHAMHGYRTVVEIVYICVLLDCDCVASVCVCVCVREGEREKERERENVTRQTSPTGLAASPECSPVWAGADGRGAGGW